MEEISNEINNLKEESEIEKDLTLNTRKKPKGYTRFFRKIIKNKAKVMKDIIQNRFFKWRKDALKGKIKKTIMIRIAVSREKEPKSKYQISKPRPKEASKSVNKNDIKSIHLNNPSQNINNIKVTKNDNKEKENYNTNIKRREVNPNKGENKNILVQKPNKNENQIYKVINTSNKNEIKPNKDLNNNKVIPYIKINNYDKNKVYKRNEVPKITPRINKNNEPYSSITQKPNQYNQKTSLQDLNKTPLSNNSNVSITYTSSTKKNDIIDQKLSKEKNYRAINNRNEIKNKIPPGNYKKYEGHNTTLPLKTVKIDLTKDKYNNSSFNNNRKNTNEHVYTNLTNDKNKIQNNNIYNNNTYQRKTNNPENKSLYNYIIKTENYNTDTPATYTRLRKENNMAQGPNSNRKNSKGGGITTVIQCFSGQSRRIENYDMNNDEYKPKK